VAFKRVHIAKGQKVPVTLDIKPQQLRTWDTGGKRYVVEPGAYELQIGAASDDIRGSASVTVP
jgi:beta-glucosidase